MDRRIESSLCLRCLADPAVHHFRPFVDYWKPLFSFNDTYMDELHQRADECGYTKFMETAMTFPPDGPLPTPPQVNTSARCDVWDDIITAAMAVNPCWG